MAVERTVARAAHVGRQRLVNRRVAISRRDSLGLARELRRLLEALLPTDAPASTTDALGRYLRECFRLGVATRDVEPAVHHIGAAADLDARRLAGQRRLGLCHFIECLPVRGDEFTNPFQCLSLWRRQCLGVAREPCRHVAQGRGTGHLGVNARERLDASSFIKLEACAVDERAGLRRDARGLVRDRPPRLVAHPQRRSDDRVVGTEAAFLGHPLQRPARLTGHDVARTEQPAQRRRCRVGLRRHSLRARRRQRRITGDIRPAADLSRTGQRILRSSFRACGRTGASTSRWWLLEPVEVACWWLSARWRGQLVCVPTDHLFQGVGFGGDFDAFEVSAAGHDG